MTDVQIVRQASETAPNDYVLPPAVSFVLKAVNAFYRDNGASGDWLPEVEILSDSGNTIARAADQAVKVTAGDDAEVSWFPGVKNFRGGAAAGAAPDYIIMTGVAHAIPSVVGGDSGLVPWDAATYVTNDASLWTFTLDGFGNITHIRTTQLGRYEAICTFHFDAPAASTDETVSVNMTGVVGGNRTSSAAITTTKVFEGTTSVFGQSSGAPSVFSADYSLDTATTSSVRGQWLWIKRWAV